MAYPRVTFALVAFRHEHFIADAVRGALAQECPPLDLIISDDASTDGTWEAIQRAVAGYDGPHRLRLNRNDVNMGMQHYNRIMQLAEGEIVVIAHGDDIAHPNRAARLVETMLAQNVSLVTSDSIVTEADGTPTGTMTGIDKSHAFSMQTVLKTGWQRNMLGATMAWRREVMERFPRINKDILPAGYDLPLVFRALLLDGAYYLAEPLLDWRRHDSNLSEQLTDRSEGPLIDGEGAASHAVIVLMAMLEDLMEFGNRNPDRKDLRDVRAGLTRLLLTHLRNWTRRRNRLFNEGKRYVWIEREEWLARRKPDSRRITSAKPLPR